MQENNDAQEVQPQQAINDDDDDDDVQEVQPVTNNNTQEVWPANNDAAGVAVNNDDRCNAQEVRTKNNDAAVMAAEPKQPMAAEAQHATGVARNTDKVMAAGVAAEVQQAAGVAGEITPTGLAETVEDAGVVVATNNDDVIVIATPTRPTELAPKKIIGQPVYKKHCKIEFWNYGKVHKSRDNTMTAHTFKALLL